MRTPEAGAGQGALSRGTILRDYSIEQVLGQGGLGIVYQARHIERGNLVAIREYMPRGLAIRDGSQVCSRHTSCLLQYEEGLRRVADEGKALTEFHGHPNIVRFQESLQCNGTAYLVMDLVDGPPLSQVLSEREGQGRPFGEEDFMSLAIPLINGLESMHRAGIIHRNLKPENVRLCEMSRQPVIVELGHGYRNLSNHSAVVNRTSSGYTAWEELVAAGQWGAWTDIYAVGALLWRIVAGGTANLSDSTPVPVENRANALIRALPDPMISAIDLGRGRFHVNLLAAIDGCLELNHDRRVQSCTKLLDLLRGDSQFQFQLARKYLHRTTESSVFKEPQIESDPTQDTSQESRSSDSIKWYLLSEEQSEQITQNHQEFSEAAEWMSMAANNGHVVAQNELAYMLFYGLGKLCDVSAAINWWTKAATLQYNEAEYTLGIIYMNSYLNSRFGESSDSSMFDDLNNCEVYRLPQDGDEFELDEPLLIEEATKWLCRAAEHGHTHAQYVLDVLGISNAFGMCGQHILSAPFPECQYEIGKLYHEGTEVPKDYAKAIKWYRIAAGHTDDHHSAISRGTHRARKQLIRLSKNYLESPNVLGRLETQANMGCPDSQYNLGWMYSQENQVQFDHEEAVRWYRLAAQQGSIRAQNNLGVCYMNGNGVPRDYRKAIEWFRLAAGLERDCVSDRFRSDSNDPRQVCWEDENTERSFHLSMRASLVADRDEEACLGGNRDVALALHNLALALIHHRKSTREYLNEFQMHIADEDSEAFKYVREAAARGNPNAQYNLGISLEHGEEPIQWFRRSATQDHIGSIQVLATMDHAIYSGWAISRLRNMVDDSLQGRSTSQDDTDLHKQAIEWYTSGGMHLTNSLELRLDFLYDMGSREILDVYLDNDYENRTYTYNQAEAGDASSQFECGIVAQFDHGFLNEEEWICGDPYARDFQKLITGFGTDYLACPEVSVGGYSNAFEQSEAFGWFEKAARSEVSSSDLDEDWQPNLGAINNLGIYRALGSDDLRDYGSAFDLFVNAATRGHAGAQFNLGVCYYRGVGTDRDCAKAFEWFSKAAHRQRGDVWHQSPSDAGYCRVVGNSISDWEYVHYDAYYEPFRDGIIDAQYNLGVSFLNGMSIARDVDASLAWLSEAASRGDRLALSELGWTSSSILRFVFETYDEYNPYPLPDTDRASITLYRTDAECNGCRCSQAFLGWMYSLGFGLERDAIEAFKWLLEAQNNVQDANEIEDYFGGEWRSRRSGKALRSATVTNDEGLPAGPDGVPWSLKFSSADREVRNECEEAESGAYGICKGWATLGDPDAQYFCGWMCATGHGSESCASEAEDWYRQAAKQGHVSACYKLGLMYDEGQVVAQDPERAAEWYRKCVRHDRADAQYRLGRLYETGSGVDIDLEEAVELYRRAAEHAHPLARFRLGLAYETGVGVQQDLKMALQYYLKAYDSNWTERQLDTRIQPAGFRLTRWPDEGET